MNKAEFKAKATVGFYKVQSYSHCIGNHVKVHQDLSPCKKFFPMVLTVPWF